MAVGLSELIYQIRLPDGPLATLFSRHHNLRILCTPVETAANGSPRRLLVSASGFGGDAAAIQAALAAYVDQIEVLRASPEALDCLGVIRAELRATMDKLLAESGAGARAVLVTRPILLRGGWMHLHLILSDAHRVEDTVVRLGQMLAAQGLEGRLARLAPFSSEHQPHGAFEDALTPKQSEILRVAFALGLYDSPRRCTLEAVAAVFGISKAAAHSRMKGAERKVVAHYFQS